MSRRDELLALEDVRWHELCARFDRLAPERWTEPGATGEWTPKDVLAHVACWHAEAASRLERYRSGTPVGLVDVDAFNVEAHRRCKDLSLKEVQAMSGAARHRFREEIALVAPEVWNERIEAVVAEDGHAHYEDHLPLLDAFLGPA